LKEAFFNHKTGKKKLIKEIFARGSGVNDKKVKI